MTRFKTFYIPLFAILCLITNFQAAAQDQKNLFVRKGDKEWTWTDAQGKTRTRAELNEILTKHEEWVATDGKSGVRAVLSGADLRGVRFAYIPRPPLNFRVHGGGVTWFLGSSRQTPPAKRPNASAQKPRGRNLQGAWLEGATLAGADLTAADLRYANLDRANLEKASLLGASLQGASLWSANLNDADLGGADLREANLKNAKLARASLADSDLTRANLAETELSNANFLGADVRLVVFEPKSLPEIREIAAANNLEFVSYDGNPDSIATLRKLFKDFGFREQERKLTYALKRAEAALLLGPDPADWFFYQEEGETIGGEFRLFVRGCLHNIANCVEYLLNRVLVDLTCQYGLSPGRPLRIALLLWLICSVVYAISIHRSGETGLVRVFVADASLGPYAKPTVEPIRLRLIGQSKRMSRLVQFLAREVHALGMGMFFSLMCAFNIGFREINFGRWLRLLTRREFDIKAVGWIRVVAGWQSLITVYLVALWILTYFGRPFE